MCVFITTIFTSQQVVHHQDSLSSITLPPTVAIGLFTCLLLLDQRECTGVLLSEAEEQQQCVATMVMEQQGDGDGVTMVMEQQGDGILQDRCDPVREKLLNMS